MYDPISVETALVSSGGDLLIQLSDGNVVNAGRVRGNPGPQGEQGESGIRGAHGKDGTDGTNGAQWHTGVGAPELAVGENNDMYMDVASALLPIFQKVNGDWLFLVNLKVPPSGGGGGSAGGAAGGGGSIIIYPKPDGGAPPSTDNDGRPIDKGDIWLDTNTGFLWVYNGTNWLPVGDRPPVIISPTPPAYNNASDHNIRYPVVEGDLWFDSDQAALYVAATNVDGDLVWVITTPADRSVLSSEASTTFRFGRVAVDGETVYNTVTELWYAYNAPKNQWIDLPPDSERLLHTKLYLDAALDGTSTTAPYEAFVDATDDEITTRITVNRIDINDTDWSVIFKELRVGAELSLMQKYKEYDPLDPDVIISEQLHISRYEVTKVTLLPDDNTADTINMEVSYLDQDADLPHQFDDDVWFILNVSLNKFVKKSGDTMTGDLVMDDANILVEDGSLIMDDSNILVEDGELIFNRTGTDVELQDEENRFSTIKSVAPYDIDTGTLDYSTKFGIKVDLDGGNSFKNNFKVGNRHGDIVRITSGEGAQIEFATSGFTPNAQNTGLTSGIAIRHIPTPSFENSPGDLAVNKKYVDARDELLRQDVIELKEEIDAIAPSLEYGTWKYEEPNAGQATRPPVSGTFFLVDGLGDVTDKYGEAAAIKIHNDEYVAPGDTDPVDNHTWADADIGELIQLFDAADPDFFLGKITAKNIDAVGECVTFTVDRIQSSGVPNDNADPITGEYLSRVNIFKEPSGGDASEFVKKIGDTMTGDLVIDTSEKSDDNEAALILKGNRPSATNSAATIKFDNEQSTEKGYLTYRSFGTSSYFKFNQDVALNNNGLHSVGQIRMEPGGYIGSGNLERIKVRDGAGNQAGTEIQRVGDNQRTFAIRGRSSGSSTNIVDIFHAYGGTTSDGIYYTGTMSEANNIVTKAYVDSKSKSVDITCDATGKGVGDMWYCSTDGVLYLKVS